MALNSSRPALSTACKALRQCRSSAPPLALQVAAPARQFSSTPARRSEAEEERPRWSFTPEQMKAPFRINVAKRKSRTIWKCNDDPAILDAMYNRLLGPNGDKLLPEEIKWLAITHKSFDYGRRGFNTRLAYFGRHVLALETTRSILVSPVAPDATHPEDSFGREPFKHPALDSVDKLSWTQPQDIIQKEKIARLAQEVGLPEVLRWKPRLPSNLENSGLTVVLTQTIYAIVGAISLQHGAEVAQRIVRERILRRLGA
ncbi:hypothetical protein OQA88_5566 [Cercophora sp. LCS_1]